MIIRFPRFPGWDLDSQDNKRDSSFLFLLKCDESIDDQTEDHGI